MHRENRVFIVIVCDLKRSIAGNFSNARNIRQKQKKLSLNEVFVGFVFSNFVM